MDQSVMVFAGTAARGSAIPSPSEGMVTYREDDDVVEVYNGSSFVPVGPGQILQVVSTTKTDVFSSSSSSFTAVTGLSASITPSSASNKVFVMVDMKVASSGSGRIIQSKLLRGATDIYIGDASNSNTRGSQQFDGIDLSVYTITPFPMVFLDSPATTSSTTYSIELRNEQGGGNLFYVNRNVDAATSKENIRTASSITLMEVAG
jgi:hypothetical protein